MQKEEKAKEVENKVTNEAEEIDDSGNAAFSSNVGFIKKILIVVGSVFLIFVIVMFLLQQLIRFDGYKKTINEEIAKVINTEVGETNKFGSSAIINGTIKYKAFPFPHIVIDDIKAANLIGENYIVNLKVEKTIVPVSLLDVIRKNIIISKATLYNVEITANEQKEKDINIIKKLANTYFEKTSSKTPIVNITFKNGTIIINGIKYKREFGKINLNTIYNHNNNNLDMKGNLLSNKQPLEVDISINKSKNESKIKAILSSQAFNFNTEMKFNQEKKELTGKSKIDIVNFQLFSRTIFNTSDFLYRRIVDNGNLKVNYDISYRDKILSLTNITMKGTNIDGVGTVEINLNNNQKNNINFDISNINIDKLLEKSLSSKKKLTEKHISIFNDGKIPEEEEDDFKSFLEKMFKTNPSNFQFKIKNIRFNNRDITDSDLDFVYFKDGTIKLKKVTSNLPGDSKLDIESKNDNDMLTLSGKHFNKIWSFLRNVADIEEQPPVQTTNEDKVEVGEEKNEEKREDLKKEEPKDDFEFSGIISINKNKIFIEDSTFKYKNIDSKNKIEIHFDSGIVFIALEVDMDNLIIDPSLVMKTKDGYFEHAMLKNELLFLNDFILNTFIKFDIKSLKYGDFIGKNYKFTTRTEPGILDIYDINLNNQIYGNVSFNIKKAKPTINAELNMNYINIEKNIDFSKIIFDLPSFEDFYGNLKINGKNIKVKKSSISNFTLGSNIENGIVNINTNIDGFGGKCNIRGFIDMQYNRKLNITFNGCSADIGQTLYLFTNINNIEGLLGFSSVIYYEGTNLQKFLDSVLVKLQFIGSGVTIKGYGIGDLVNGLINMNADYEFAKIINPEAILNNQENKTIFEKLSGNLQYSKRTNGNFEFDISRDLLNGKGVGTFSLIGNNNINLELNANFIALIVTLQNSVPLNLTTKVVGYTPNNLSSASNLDQINTYVTSLRKTIEEAEERERLKKEALKTSEEQEQPI